MNWTQLLSGKRFGMEEYHERKHERTDFQRDYDRLIFSSPFRRLQNKTQVFPLPGSIFVHNRLTHSLEVSCVGRSLGNNVAKGLMQKYPDGSINFPEIGSIVSAACLAHDMGNPPFGHSGERAISAYFLEGNGSYLEDEIRSAGGRWEDFLHFEGNANAMRLLTHRPEKRRICFNLQYIGLYRQISLCIGSFRQKREVRFFPVGRRNLYAHSYRIGNKPQS